jgi:hypothetical protein
MSPKKKPPDRNYGGSWRDRLEEARRRASQPSAGLSEGELARLLEAASSLEVSSPHDGALFWSGKDILTGIPLKEDAGDGRLWWDKHAPLDAKVFRDLGLAVSVEDTPCGRYVVDLGLNPAPDDPLTAVLQNVWEIVSARFAESARGRVEILAEGAWEDGVFRGVEWETLLGNANVTCINGLDRALLPNRAEDAFFLIRRWDIERNRRYVEFLGDAPDATPPERAKAIDDYREAQLWYEQDFFDQLGPNRAWPALPSSVLSATDRTREVKAWKYSPVWRAFTRQEKPA